MRAYPLIAALGLAALAAQPVLAQEKPPAVEAPAKGSEKAAKADAPDLAQASVRAMDQALGATPVALLAGGDLARDFTLKALPAEQGLDWVQASPKRSEGNAFQSLRLGFKGKELAALELVDAFGQRSLMQFSGLQINLKLAPERFRFEPPAGTDLV